MAKRIDTNSSNTSVDMYIGVMFSLSCVYTDLKGTPINLTGKTIVCSIKNVFPTLSTISSTSPVDVASPYINITDPLHGKFDIYLPATETAKAKAGIGKWWLELNDGVRKRLMSPPSNVVVRDV